VQFFVLFSVFRGSSFFLKPRISRNARTVTNDPPSPPDTSGGFDDSMTKAPGVMGIFLIRRGFLDTAGFSSYAPPDSRRQFCHISYLTSHFPPFPGAIRVII
jgi:hypothetical protein